MLSSQTAGKLRRGDVRTHLEHNDNEELISERATLSAPARRERDQTCVRHNADHVDESQDRVPHTYITQERMPLSDRMTYNKHNEHK